MAKIIIDLGEVTEEQLKDVIFLMRQDGYILMPGDEVTYEL